MASSFRFAVIQARPDTGRGEQVNVGLIVETAQGFDVRFPEIRKLKPLTGHSWNAVSEAYVRNAAQAWATRADIDALRRSDEWSSEVFILGEPGLILADTPIQYEQRVKSILDYFVSKPVLSRAQRQEAINSQIAKVFRKDGLLREGTETIEDHKVVPNFTVSEEKGLVADFAYKSKRLKVLSTLDLRGVKSAHSKACEKGATLFFARKAFGEDVGTFAVYAVSPLEADMRKGEVEILRDFAKGNVFNWSNAQDRGKFVSAFY
jgi:hypothetical protein